MMKEKIKRLLPPANINIQLYKDYEKKVNKKYFIEKINKEDNEIKKILLENSLDFNVICKSIEKSFEFELFKQFNLKLPIIFVEERNIMFLLEIKANIVVSDAIHIALSLLLNSYILWRLNYKNLAKAYFQTLQNNTIFTNSSIQIKNLTLKQYCYIVTDKFSEKELEELNLKKFDMVTECLIFFFLHEYSRIKYPYIRNEIEIDNIAIKHFLKKYPEEKLIYPYMFFKFMSYFDKSLKDRAINLSKYLKNLDEINKYFKEMQ